MIILFKFLTIPFFAPPDDVLSKIADLSLNLSISRNKVNLKATFLNTPTRGLNMVFSMC